MNDKKLIYILNHYSEKSATHFFHILHLLEEMAAKDVDIALIIEKCDSLPVLRAGSKIKVYPQRFRSRIIRPFELFFRLVFLGYKGFHTVFIRISWVAGVTAILASLLTRQKTWYWLSGQGSFETYAETPFGVKKVILFFTSFLPFYILKKGVYRMATGPQTMCEYMVTTGKVSREKVALLYNDISLSRFAPVSTEIQLQRKSQLNTPIDHMVVLFVHRFSPVRKTSYYIPHIFHEIASELEERLPEDRHPKMSVLMVGGGPEKDKIMEETNELDLPFQVKWLGELPNRDIESYYQVADLFIHPTWAEGFPRVLLEAMASGLPVVTTDAGGIRDLVGQYQRTFMVPKEDRKQFAIKCVDLLLSETMRQQVAAENRIHARQFDTPAVADMYIDRLFQ